MILVIHLPHPAEALFGSWKKLRCVSSGLCMHSKKRKERVCNTIWFGGFRLLRSYAKTAVRTENQRFENK